MLSDVNPRVFVVQVGLIEYFDDRQPEIFGALFQNPLDPLPRAPDNLQNTSVHHEPSGKSQFKPKQKRMVKMREKYPVTGLAYVTSAATAMEVTQNKRRKRGEFKTVSRCPTYQNERARSNYLRWLMHLDVG